jgi:thiosulfate/3-mercaptopyruvate sulfurtransferase
MVGEILITAVELAGTAVGEVLPGGGPLRVLDVRWRLDRPDGRPDYLAGHLPGALYVDLGTQLARHGDPKDGRHPLPPVEQLQAHAREWGIDPGDTVVVYDDLKNLSAARAWWLLRYAGVADVRLLDGALSAWTAAGLPLETGEAPVPVPGSVSLRYGALRALTIDEAAAFPASGVLLDARAGERFRGEVEPIDPRAGHIPGARSAPTTENVDADGRFLGADQLRARFAALGVEPGTPVAAYCGSGVTAAHEAVALALAGFDAALFPGSWSQWANHPELPAETGATRAAPGAGSRS